MSVENWPLALNGPKLLKLKYTNALSQLPFDTRAQSGQQNRRPIIVEILK